MTPGRRWKRPYKASLLFGALLLLRSPPGQAFTYVTCSQLAHDQRVTGLEPGLAISSAANVAGFGFYLADSNVNPWVAFSALEMVSLGGLLTVVTSGCAVVPDAALGEHSFKVLPFKTREEARRARSATIRLQLFVLGNNFLISGLMLLAARDRPSRIALGVTTAFPLIYAAASYRILSPEREIDDLLPVEDTSHAPQLTLLRSESGSTGLGLRLRF